MLIKQQTVVDIVGGRLAGGRGVVREINIVQETGDAMLWVDVFNLQTGGVDLMMFEPLQLKRSTGMNPSQIERMRQLAIVLDGEQ